MAGEITAYLDGVQVQLRQAEVDRVASCQRAGGGDDAVAAAAALYGGVLSLSMLENGAAGWWTYEKRVRLLSRRRGRSCNLAELKQRHGDWAEARAAAERAAGRLGNSGPDDVQRRLRRVRADLQMLQRLEQIRLGQGQPHDGQFNQADALRAYAARSLSSYSI